MQVAFSHVDSGTALSLVPAVHAICHCVYFLLRGPKDPVSRDKGLFLGISFRVTDNLDRVSRECGGSEEQGSRRYHLPPEDEGRKGYSTHRKS